MPFQLPDPRRANEAPEPEAPAVEPEALTDEGERLLADPEFFAAFVAWRNAR